MHRLRNNGFSGVWMSGLLGLGFLALTSGSASAQLLFDGNILWNNNASGTLAGQLTGAAGAGAPSCPGGYGAITLGTVDFTNNLYADPLLPSAAYQANVVPEFQPGIESPAFQGAIQVPADGFFDDVCFRGAIGPYEGEDWTEGWTYWDSTGATRDDLHLPGMTDPRPLATYDNIRLYASQVWSADSNYLIRGQLRVKEQASLTIAAGVVVFQERASVGTLIVERGAQIFANGTQEAPIIITGDDAPGTMARGAGGGLIVHGRARTNAANSCAGDSAASEGGAVGYYGGSDDDDNSGVVRYVRVEYAGVEITPNNELNSFVFNAVGRSTTIEYIQAHRGADDGIEFFGGTAQGKYLVATDGTDDGFDWQMGYRGKAQFVISRVSPEFSPNMGQNGEKGIEADNNEFDNNQRQCSGFSNPSLSNFTLIGDKRAGVNYPGAVIGVNFRRGTGATFINAIVAGFKTNGLRVDNDPTWEHHCAAPPVPLTVCTNTGTSTASNPKAFVVFSRPNPFRGDVHFHFTLASASSDVRVEIYSAGGQRLSTVHAGALPAGEQSIRWNAKNVPGGVYFYRVATDDGFASGKVVRLEN